ncbi:MAG: hypothetical protein VKP70_08320 [Cyanobacteriota bacterium]|nr:hypothetical protein [Cyanobacteriota bacterium]
MATDRWKAISEPIAASVAEQPQALGLATVWNDMEAIQTVRPTRKFNILPSECLAEAG